MSAPDIAKAEKDSAAPSARHAPNDERATASTESPQSASQDQLRGASMASPSVDPALLLGELRDSAVRDLAWLLFSPPLLRAQSPVGAVASLFSDADEVAATIDWLRTQDRAPDDMHRALASARVTRVGRLAELLMSWYLQHGPAARLVAANVALRRAGVTLGECDFLVETQHGRRLHWELAVKCYLHAGDDPLRDETATRLSDYVGPNLQDRFDLKLRHLLDHQLPLSARAEFASLGHAGPWDAQMLIRGWLFYERYRPGATSVDAPEVDPAHARGWWVTQRDWPAFAGALRQSWRVLPRLEWLAPRHDPRDQRFERADQVAALCAKQHGPTMIAGFVDDGDGSWVEGSRGFIVPDDWPARARAFARQ